LTVLLLSAAAARADQPVASFTWSPTSPVGGSDVTFTDTSTEIPTSWLWTFGDPLGGLLNTSTAQSPIYAYNLPGTYVVTLTAINADGTSAVSHRVVVSDGGAPLCVEAIDHLCLDRTRFSVSADWTTPDGTTGHGTAVKLTTQAGYFWFFEPANVELTVKVLNGCWLNNSYWVFASGLTNVAVVLNITDERTGATFSAVNQQGTAFVAVQDAAAFPASCP
jgi:uncharacterized membrane protein